MTDSGNVEHVHPGRRHGKVLMARGPRGKVWHACTIRAGSY